MKTYNCKNEELPVIAEYLLFSLKKDMAAFTAFSPKFNEAYVTAFEEKIAAVAAILNPHNETIELKKVTEHLYSTMNSLIDPIARVEGYVKTAGSANPIGIKDFGLSLLRKKVWAKDAEGVLVALKTVNDHINTCKSTLVDQGLSDDLIAVFTSSTTAIHDDNQRQYQIVTARKRLVNNNLSLFNELYALIMEVCGIGKILYKKDAVLLKEYTFTELKKRVRTVHNPQSAKPASEKEQS
ncbi:MAG: hypothetical protein LBD53_04610 [Tannerella sp.]|jgi:hypothetical protein|nr:hypothetical protein [Tannerella sp.]